MILYRSARESGTNAPVAQLDRVTDYESVGQGFESLPAYQKNRYPIRDDGFSYMSGGTRKDGRAKRGKKVSGGHFFSPWESPLILGRIRYGCGPKSNPNRASKSDIFGYPIFFVFTEAQQYIKAVRLIENSFPRGGHPRVASLALRTIHLQVARPSASEEKAGRKRNAGGNPKVCTS